MAEELIDTNVFCGHWPFRALRWRTPGELKDYLLGHGVTQAWVTATEAILYPDPMEGNEPLFEAIKGDAFFVPFAVLDITLASWREDARRCVDQWGVQAFKLFPNYHQYELFDHTVDEFVQFSVKEELRISFQIRMMDERAHHPLMAVRSVPSGVVVKIGNRYPEAKILICGGYTGDLRQAGRAKNIWADISLADDAQALRAAVEGLGSEKVVFGSHSPFLYFDAVAAKLDVDSQDVPAQAVQAIRAANARNFFTPAR
jgi:predicted TIM-barrel fold metal-dependent hydrolase